MVEQANYLTGNILHFKTCLQGTLQHAECLKKERGFGAAGEFKKKVQVKNRPT